MNLWDKTTAGRGSNEIASALWNYLTTKYPVLAPGTTRELVLWSDRCTGQNNNFIVLTMLTCLVRQGIFTNVNHKFFVTGHSYNDCDRDFGNLEVKLRKNSIMVPSDIDEVVVNARSEKPFECYRMPANKFKDFMELSRHYRRPDTLKVTQNLWFQYEAASLQNILTRENHNVVSQAYTVSVNF